MKKYHLVFIVLFLSIQSYAQMKGIVYGAVDTKRQVIKGAKITLLKSKMETYSSEEGRFELVLPKDLPDVLVVEAKGYLPDSIEVTQKDRFISLEITLYSEKLLPEIIIERKKNTHGIAKLKVLQVEELNAGEFRKAACCNLSESFETNASVDINMTDALSGAKKIRMMGLDGTYTQLQMENIPWLRGLESAFGLTSIPGTWLESIQITKGTGNVVNGYESMAGLVNIELKKPAEMEKFYLNAYGSIFGRAELNLNAGQIINKNWSTGTLAHGSAMLGEMDNNKDGFRDIPMGYNASVLNRWSYQGSKMEAQLGVNAYTDQKLGGQLGFKSFADTSKYGVQIDSKHIDVFAKTGFFLKKPYNSIGVVYNVKYQTVFSQFGRRAFNGEEKRAYINAIYDGIIGNTSHKIKVGLTGNLFEIEQELDSMNSDRVELVPGAFAEYNYIGMRLITVVGMRADYHNLFGIQLSPRLHMKYALTEKTDLRFTAGKGWRVPNYIIDNVSLLASSKNWISPDTIRPEISWNTGGSLVQEFKLFGRKADFVTDIYYTFFENQLVVDRDLSTNAIAFKNTKNKSFSTSFQAELSFSILKNLDVRLAYRYIDVRAEFGGKMQQQVMIPPQRGFFNIGYITRNKRWEYNATLTVFGPSRLPDTGTNERGFSSTYPILNAQITHVFKRWDFYIGGENITNFKQKDAIISAENPFSASFDATQIWGPVMGISVYAGCRYVIKRKK